MGKARLIGRVSFLALLVAGCGSSGGDGPGVSPPPPPPPPPPVVEVVPTIALAQVFPSLTFSGLVSLQQAPGDATRWFAVEQAGTIRSFANDNDVAATLTFLDITGRVIAGGERGLLGLAFHPDFPNTPEVFVSYTGAPDLTSYVSRFSSVNGGQTLDPASEQVILSVPQDFANHNGGNIVFGPDGYLYIGFGDGGSGGDPLDRAQDTTNLLGTMVRIDVDGGSPYAIPSADPGNPFAANAACPQGFTVSGEACPEIFAWGLRNPWRFSFDRQGGALWAGDVGQNAWEEIDVIVAGGDYGWNDREGAHCFEPPTAALPIPSTRSPSTIVRSALPSRAVSCIAAARLPTWPAGTCSAISSAAGCSRFRRTACRAPHPRCCSRAASRSRLSPRRSTANSSSRITVARYTG